MPNRIHFFFSFFCVSNVSISLCMFIYKYLCLSICVCSPTNLPTYLFISLFKSVYLDILDGMFSIDVFRQYFSLDMKTRFKKLLFWISQNLTRKINSAEYSWPHCCQYNHISKVSKQAINTYFRIYSSLYVCTYTSINRQITIYAS